MTADGVLSVVLIVAAVGVLGYLLVALIYPERF